MLRNWQTMLLALGLAIFTWFLVTGREVIETVVEMPVVMTNPPEGMIIEGGLVDKIQVRLRGPKGLVDALASQHLTYPLDVSHVRIGQQVLEIETRKLPLTASYEVIELKPNRLNLTVDKISTKTIPVEASWSGKINSDYQFLRIESDPAEVVLRGPETKLRKIAKTQLVLEEDFMDDVPASWVEDLGMRLPDEIEATPAQVRLEVFFGPKTRDIWVKIPLSVKIIDGIDITPAQNFVRLHIEGPVALFRNDVYRKTMEATLQVNAKLSAGRSDLDYEVTLPDGCRLLKKNPEKIKTTIKIK